MYLLQAQIFFRKTSFWICWHKPMPIHNNPTRTQADQWYPPQLICRFFPLALANFIPTFGPFMASVFPLPLVILDPHQTHAGHCEALHRSNAFEGAEGWEVRGYKRCGVFYFCVQLWHFFGFYCWVWCFFFLEIRSLLTWRVGCGYKYSGDCRGLQPTCHSRPKRSR